MDPMQPWGLIPVLALAGCAALGEGSRAGSVEGRVLLSGPRLERERWPISEEMGPYHPGHRAYVSFERFDAPAGPGVYSVVDDSFVAGKVI